MAGAVCFGRCEISLSKVLAGQSVGIREVDDPVWLVSLLDYDSGYVHQDRGRVEPEANLFAPEQV